MDKGGIYLGIGSNQGDRKQHLEDALKLLAGRGVETIRASRLYETPPWGITEQASFLNAVAEVHFSGSPEDLMTLILEVEAEMGRIRKIKWGPRLIDIDILAFGGEKRDTELLKIPHPFIADRLFVLIPLAEIAPDFSMESPDGKVMPVTDAIDQFPREEIETVKAVATFPGDIITGIDPASPADASV